jgi:hypothetical protein
MKKRSQVIEDANARALALRAAFRLAALKNGGFLWHPRHNPHPVVRQLLREGELIATDYTKPRIGSKPELRRYRLARMVGK